MTITPRAASMPGKVERPADLYAVPPEQFTAARQALVASLRKAGDAAGAAEAAAIKRPTRALWAVNQLARQDGTVVARLIDAAERLKMAQLGRRPGGDMREASEAYQALLKRCEEHARALLQPVGPGLTVAVRNRLTRTLAAAAADPALRPALREGRLPHEVATAGFDVFSGVRPLTRVPSRPKGTGSARTAAAGQPAAPSDHERLGRLMRARTALAEAQATLAKAQAGTVELVRTAAGARRQADEAQRAAERSKAEEETASRRVAEAEQALHAAESVDSCSPSEDTRERENR